MQYSDLLGQFIRSHGGKWGKQGVKFMHWENLCFIWGVKTQNFFSKHCFVERKKVVIRVVIWAKMQDTKISYLYSFLTNCMSLEEWIPCVTQSRTTDGPSVHRELL